jgi:GT2 family glycosyltransferase
VVEISQFVEPRVNVLILAYRRAALPESVAALVTSTHDVEYQVSILLNGATDAVTDAVRNSIRGADIDESPTNLGFSAGMNRLADKAQGEFIVLLNDDTEVQDGWLDQLVRTADEFPTAGMITSRLVFPDGRLQEAGSRLSYSGIGVQVGWGEPDTDETLWQRREVDYGSAAALLIRREAFEQVGGFDEAFFPAYYEDVDLALRIRAAGWKAIYEPAAIATHHQWGSTTAGQRTYAMTYNRRTFLDRWGHLFEDTSSATNEGPDQPIEIPPDSTISVERGHRTTPWENYAEWLVGQLVDSEGRSSSAQARMREVDDELKATVLAYGGEVAELRKQLTNARQLAASETARADHHQRERAAIEALAMWKIRRIASKVVRSSAALAKRLDRRNR